MGVDEIVELQKEMRFYLFFFCVCDDFSLPFGSGIRFGFIVARLHRK